MAIEVTSDRAICSKCGTAYSRRKGFFPVSYASLYKGTGYIPVCRKCIDELYSTYLSQCGDSRMAVRQVCRKLDLYWNDKIFDSVVKKSSTMSIMTQYISRSNNVSCAGKSYDDTLLDEGDFWNLYPEEKSDSEDTIDTEEPAEEIPKASEETIKFWGSGYSDEIYMQLNQRKDYYMDKFQSQGVDIDVGAEILIKQICNLDVSIARDSAAGKSIDKSVNTLNTIVGSLNLKPAQKKDDGDSVSDNTPMGVWIKKFEDNRPIPEVDPEFKDVDGIIRYISIWFLGHASKMLGKKNIHCKLYEDEIKKMRVDRPEFEDDDDETLFNEVFSSPSDESSAVE